ncbi:hypothetical protein ACFWPK_11645 [Nocardia sp. NPDC058519]|uniref:hypothetical protein n=1 Tax=Nocardia sp. NPDC058519 TaxID=3346535 RepID=UPI003652831D
MTARLTELERERAAHIAALVAKAPPLTAAQAHIIRTAFAGTSITHKSQGNAA